jgi:predicted dehydrogenase
MIRIAVIGCGRWGPNHIRNFSSLLGSKVVVAVDTDSTRLERVSKMFPSLRVEQEYQQVIEDPDVDAVVIATPTVSHYKLVHDALMKNKHVLCEKPLCETTTQAQELVELSIAHRLVLMVGHVFLFNSGIIKVKELIHGGELGKLYYLFAIRTNLGPIRNDVNVAYDLVTHDISIFNFWLNSEPEIVSATGASFLQTGIEDVVFISLKYPNDIFASIQASWLNPKKVRQITVVGSQKMITWDDLELNTPVAIYDSGANVAQEYSDYAEFLRISMWDRDIRLPKIQMEEPLKLQDRYFLEAIQQGNIERSDGVFALGVIKTLEGIAKSLKLNGSPVQISP